MSWLEVRNLTKIYRDFRLELDFCADQGELVAILGPSGAGKSTLLRLMAGLIRPDSGQLLIDGLDLAGLSPRERGIGLVFQDFALFPHYSVGQNIEYGLKLRHLAAAERHQRAQELLQRFALPDFASRRPGSLSGGEKQRVALARALAVEPRLMLFDEPLGSLDAALRKELRSELRLLQTELGYTSISVTHDQEDAMAISDRLLVMRDGRIVQSGTPEEVYRRPASAFVASFFGEANLLPLGDGSGAWERLQLGSDRAGTSPACLFIRSEEVQVADRQAGPSPAGGTPPENRITAVILDFEFLGRGYLVRGRMDPPGSGEDPAEIRFWADQRPVAGDRITLILPRGQLQRIPLE